MTNTFRNPGTQKPTSSLRTLYFSRTIIQFIWAALVIAFATSSPLLAVILMVAYPLWDVACTLFDLSSSNTSDSTASSKTLQYCNIALGVVTAIGIGVGASSEMRYAVAAFGAWAFAAGLLQLAVGIYRRSLMKGQWAMILSGVQSMIAGGAFLFGGLGGKVHVKDLGGYAVFGGVYFLISAILLGRKNRSLETTAAGA
ncbi:hypothetical protein [Terriglobus saanensis]|uniref:Transmembrane protein n=1 Tax=Terriglobus saanensis (strain ATCC BAA-1853 / DSM 23119 / SP1PR4) TaxID=401053 RepID=E8V1T6_TERSS|nr:hypothetical protein [Terriglobus saanensis]ADV83424.1 hypothetical protein AciPR4_2646 [Terriglobus saanensis SP1PR4]